MVAWVRDELERGVPADQLRLDLAASGWSSEDVAEILSIASAVPLQYQDLSGQRQDAGKGFVDRANRYIAYATIATGSAVIVGTIVLTTMFDAFAGTLLLSAAGSGMVLVLHGASNLARREPRYNRRRR